MSSIKYEGQRIGHRAQEAGNAFFDSFKNFTRNWKDGAATTTFVEKAPSRWTAPFRASARAGMWVAEQPIAWVMKPISWMLGAVSGFYTKFPRLAPIATVLGGAAAIGSYFTRRRSEALQENYASMQAQAMASQSASPYMNSVTPDEMAALNAQMKTSAAGVSHADAVAAARAQAADKAAASGQATTSVA